MPLQLHLTKFLILSLALHALIAAVMVLVNPEVPELPAITPVRIVNLPPQAEKQLPPLRPDVARPVPPAPRRTIPERPLPPESVPMPKKFGEDEELRLPRTSPPEGAPERAEQGKEAPKKETDIAQPPGKTGTLPFLSQAYIDELARKGMPEKKPGDDSITLDTDEFKFISYNRWLKIKVESTLRYPELAAVSGYQGTLFIKFDILKDGSLGGVEVLKPSAYKILDDEAVRAIRASAPFAELPDEWNMERYSIRAAIIFYLGSGYIR
jgi:protein TonB